MKIYVGNLSFNIQFVSFATARPDSHAASDSSRWLTLARVAPPAPRSTSRSSKVAG